MWVLNEIERLGQERTESEKANRKSLDEAHGRIRELKTSRDAVKQANDRTRLKLWITAAAASFLGTVVIELLKMALQK